MYLLLNLKVYVAWTACFLMKNNCFWYSSPLRKQTGRIFCRSVVFYLTSESWDWIKKIFFRKRYHKLYLPFSCRMDAGILASTLSPTVPSNPILIQQLPTTSYEGDFPFFPLRGSASLPHINPCLVDQVKK